MRTGTRNDVPNEFHGESVDDANKHDRKPRQRKSYDGQSHERKSDGCESGRKYRRDGYRTCSHGLNRYRAYSPGVNESRARRHPAANRTTEYNCAVSSRHGEHWQFAATDVADQSL
jgi:hypothetical protein